MAQVKIVSNAVCDLAPERARELGVVLIPETIVFGGVPMLSNRDFTPPELYRRMRETGEMPTGSQPNVAMYIDAFREAGEGADEIVCLNMTGRMSGSFNTANIAREALADEGFRPKIYICDTLQLSHGLGFLVEDAAEMSASGASGERIMERLEAEKNKVVQYFVLRSLEAARRGGRLGNITARVAQSLNVKPVLMLRDGIDSDAKLTFSFRQALKSLAPYYEKLGKKGGRVTVFHADNEADALLVKEQIESIDPAAAVNIAWLGTGIGIYTGEGCVGITFREP